jgi:S1-C subfamily serine protease
LREDKEAIELVLLIYFCGIIEYQKRFMPLQRIEIGRNTAKGNRISNKYFRKKEKIMNAFIDTIFSCFVLVGFAHAQEISANKLADVILNGQEIRFSSVVQKAQSCVFRVENQDKCFLGTAFTINRYGNLITCAHVVGQLDSVLLENLCAATNNNGDTIQLQICFAAKVISLSPELDLAILKVDLSLYKFIASPFLEFGNSDNLKLGQSIALCAFIADEFMVHRPFISKGIISSIRRGVFSGDCIHNVDLIEADLNVSKGTSGGPIFLVSSGMVVGIQDMGLFEFPQSSQTAYAVALSINQITSILDSLQIDYNIK